MKDAPRPWATLSSPAVLTLGGSEKPFRIITYDGLVQPKHQHETQEELEEVTAELSEDELQEVSGGKWCGATHESEGGCGMDCLDT